MFIFQTKSLIMKNKIYYFFIISCIGLINLGCKKENTEILKEKEAENSRKFKVENGYLHFDNYDVFLSYFQNISSLPVKKRKEWENSNGFTSLGTIYENFNSELQSLEDKKPVNALEQYANLKHKYKNEILFTDSTYSINCTGIREALLANKDGIVRVGDDFIQFGIDGYHTYRATSSTEAVSFNKLSSLKPNSGNRFSIINGLQPVANSLSVVPGNYTVISSGNGKFYARIKIYNTHSDAGGYRGFVALECFAQHDNWIGVWADRKSLVGVVGSLDLELVKGTLENTISTTPINAVIGGGLVFTPPGTPPPSTGNENLTERYELILATSQYLKNNPAPVFGVGNNIEFGNNPVIINDDFIQPIGYWKSTKSVVPQIPLAYRPLKIVATSGADVFENTIHYPETELHW